MIRHTILLRPLLPLLLLLIAPVAGAEGIAIISHDPLPRVDTPVIRRLFTGKVVEIRGVSVSPINLPAGHPLRTRFLATFLGQDEEHYTSYWTVRRFVGLGSPPVELRTSAEVIAYVRTNPGAVAYIDADEVPAGMNILQQK